ncbi:hypothetical protein PUN28_014077 [Cardiocondyla obscurior]|uniref:Uncharacterized protein n=1 Tax=Cardiocondyla obscurior TaxID=286306 RepID=A0AAW2F5X8_9HYME
MQVGASCVVIDGDFAAAAAAVVVAVVKYVSIPRVPMRPLFHVNSRPPEHRRPSSRRNCLPSPSPPPPPPPPPLPPPPGRQRRRWANRRATPGTTVSPKIIKRNGRMVFEPTLTVSLSRTRVCHVSVTATINCR